MLDAEGQEKTNGHQMQAFPCLSLSVSSSLPILDRMNPQFFVVSGSKKINTLAIMFSCDENFMRVFRHQFWFFSVVCHALFVKLMSYPYPSDVKDNPNPTCPNHSFGRCIMRYSTPSAFSIEYWMTLKLSYVLATALAIFFVPFFFPATAYRCNIAIFFGSVRLLAQNRVANKN